MHLDGRKQISTPAVRNSAHGSSVPVREGNGTNELRYTIPYRLQPTSVVLYVHLKKERDKKK